jgi:hypothetical protein
MRRNTRRRPVAPLAGLARDDVIDGGSGFDTVRALGGKDRCRSVERRTSCELLD